MHAAMSASGSVTLSTSAPTGIDMRHIFARAGGAMLSSTKPFRDPLTSQRSRKKWTPAAYTGPRAASALVIDVKGMSAANAHPILTCNSPPSTRSSLVFGPIPSGREIRRYQRSKRSSSGTA